MRTVSGRYGITWTPRATESETHRVRLFVCGVGVVILSAFIVYKVSHRKDVSAPALEEVPVETQEALVAPPVHTNMPPPVQVAPLREEVLPTQPPSIRILMDKLAQAEKKGSILLAIDTLKQLVARPVTDEQRMRLMIRLGAHHVRLLLSGSSTPWTTIVTVKSGDTCARLAREHRTTVSSVMMLNPGVDWHRLKVGAQVRVLEFPNAILKISRATEKADLYFKNQFFKRYDLVSEKDTPTGTYPISNEVGETPSARLRTLGLHLAPSERTQLESFLAPGSHIEIR